MVRQMQATGPTISIITPCLNAAQFLRRALDSVLNQGYQNLEHIVVEGGSTDGSLEILARYPHIRLVRARSQGVYESLNQGLSISSGQIIGQLNADDEYELGALAAAAKAFAEDEYLDAFCGGAVVTDGGRIVRDCRGLKQRQLSFDAGLLGTPIINAKFFRREFLNKLNGYDPSYRLLADRDLLVRAILVGCRWKDNDQLLYRYRIHPPSLTHNYSPQAMKQLTEESLVLSTRWLAEPSAPPALRRVCRIRYGKSILRLLFFALRERTPTDIFHAFRALVSYQGRLSWRPSAYAVRAFCAWMNGDNSMFMAGGAELEPTRISRNGAA